jgi:hypothetical protein
VVDKKTEKIIGAKFLSSETRGTRTIFVFDVNGKKRNFNVFEPQSPSLILGRNYDFSVEQKIKGGATYFNLVRKSMNGPYDIKETKQTVTSTFPEFKAASESFKNEKKEYTKSNYWEDKAERDKVTDGRVIRESALKSAINYCSSDACDKARSSVDEILDIAEKFEKWIKEAR